MNYNRKDLADLYGQVRGNKVPDHKHLQIYGEGTSEEHNIAARNDIGFKDKKGNWIFKRASDGFINDIMVPEMAYAESGSYMKAVLKRARAAGIVGEEDTINTPKVKLIYNYVAAAAGSKNKISHLIKDLGSTKAQNDFIGSLSLSNTNQSNLFNLVNKEYGSAFEPNHQIMIMRPAGEDEKTRGAAGPGETLFAFLLKGSKPVEGDLVLNNNIIELKKNGGRIGKNLTTSALADFKSKFNQVQGGKGGLPRTQEDGSTLFTEEELNLPLGSIIDKYSGTEETIGKNGVFGTRFGDWLENNTRAAPRKDGNSTYTTLVQYIAILQLRQYNKAVLAGQNTKFIVVFDVLLNYTGFELKDLNIDADQLVNQLRKKNIFFGPKLDGDGYQIYISPNELQPL